MSTSHTPPPSAARRAIPQATGLLCLALAGIALHPLAHAAEGELSEIVVKGNYNNAVGTSTAR